VPHQHAYLLTLTVLAVDPNVMLALLSSGQAQYGYMMTGLAESADSNGDIERLLDYAKALPKDDVQYDAFSSRHLLCRLVLARSRSAET